MLAKATKLATLYTLLRKAIAKHSTCRITTNRQGPGREGWLLRQQRDLLWAVPAAQQLWAWHTLWRLARRGRSLLSGTKLHLLFLQHHSQPTSAKTIFDLACMPGKSFAFAEPCTSQVVDFNVLPSQTT